MQYFLVQPYRVTFFLVKVAEKAVILSNKIFSPSKAPMDAVGKGTKILPFSLAYTNACGIQLLSWLSIRHNMMPSLEHYVYF